MNDKNATHTTGIHNLVDVCKKKEQVWLAVRI